MSKGDIILHVSPREDVRHHRHGYRVPTVILRLFFRATPLNGTTLLVSRPGLLLSFVNSRSTRPTLEKHNTLLTGDVGVVFGEQEKARDKRYAKSDDNAIVLHAGQILSTRTLPALYDLPAICDCTNSHMKAQ